MSEERASNHHQPSVRLRAVNTDDESFLQTVYGDSRAEELARVPWSDAQRDAFVQMQFTAQQNHYREFFPNATHEIILVDESPAGRLYVDRRDGEIRILDISLLTEKRGQGIGSQLINALIEEADAAGKSISVYVESYNPSKLLFERLGFRQIEDDGVNLLLERPAIPATERGG
jgi:ribosomal protein S18 acetylase RimI-like enzyme